MVKKDYFKKVLLEIIQIARVRGENYIEISAKELHEKVGGYTGPNHSMPSCCDAMYEHAG